uniref:Exportin-2 central domain-containing protein n=1 Tax=Clytia hemisphaerica TaxID=252671 RepID=A0A7M5X8J5_9CNID
MISCDFPEKWPDLVNRINGYLTSDVKETWLGALLVLYQLVKKYEFKTKEDRGTIEEIMNVFLPILHSRCASWVKDDSLESYLLITKVFKIFRALIQLHLPLNIINQNNFPQWMGLFKTVLEKPVPEASLQYDEDDRSQLSWWKAKKWAITVLHKVFERYGCPGSEEKEFSKFADFYDKNYSEQVTGLMLKILDAHRKQTYIAPRVLQQCLSYLNQGVYNARSWKLVKPHFQEIFKDILFPLMCHSEEDEALWLDDPQEYIRIKYDIFEEYMFFSPSATAKSYLKEAAQKRKNVLTDIIAYINEILNLDASQRNPKHKDGALHVLGSLAELLSKKKAYKGHIEQLLAQHVAPEFHSPLGFLRARACWVVQQFAIISFKDDNTLALLFNSVLQGLTDKDLPVQVEAGIALRQLMSEQEEAAESLVRPHVKGLVQQILHILKESENDELTNTISKLVQNFPEEVTQISLELVHTLTETFNNLVESDEDYDSKSVTAMGILETIENIVGELDGAPEIMIQIEQIVVGLIQSVLKKELMEYYEEVFALINECTTVQVSPVMWNVLFLLMETFHNDTADYFTDYFPEMMPCLHNYVTVDPQAFLANPKYCEVIFNMCKQMLIEYTGEGAQCQAAKLLEVIVLQYRGHLDSTIPAFISLCLERLSMDLKTSELRVMLLQVIISCVISNPILTLSHLEKCVTERYPMGFTNEFLQLWLNDTDCFLGMHDRKVYVFGICSLLTLPPENRPQAVELFAPQFVPALLVVFKGLITMYEKYEKDIEEETEEKPAEEEELNDSDDEYDEEGTQYVEMLNQKRDKGFDFFDDDEFANELEMFTTPLDDNPYVDEFITFKNTFQGIQAGDGKLFTVMTQSLNEEQKNNVQFVINTGINKQNKLESMKLEEQGGFQFQVANGGGGGAAPEQNFNFGGSLPSA